MTVTLCIETSTAYCSLALADQNGMFCRHEKLLRRHNEQVLPMLDALYQEAGIAVRDTALLASVPGRVLLRVFESQPLLLRVLPWPAVRGWCR